MSAANRPRLLDLFCGAGGAARGYRAAGFYVVGVDNKPQPNYCGDEFVEADAFEYLAEEWSGFVAAHGSPVCKDYSPTRALHTTRYPRWIAPLRMMLLQVGLPYVIENVAGARGHMLSPLTLCGSSFGLGVRRHRLFETSWQVMRPPQCRHDLQPEPIDVTGTGARRSGDRPDGRGGNSRKPRNLAEARAAMGIDWMNRNELSQAIPPAYTQFIGEQLIAHISERAA